MTDIKLVKDDLRPPEEPPKRHFISIQDVTRADVERLLATARTLERSMDREVKKLPTLKGRLVINVFYESSTRTSSSFELAAKRLSADTMSIKSSGSSVDKGESLKDTAITLGAYDPDLIVIRHPQIGAPELVARVTSAHVVNAGDGKHQHPTQALLDLYTIQEEFGRVEGLHVAIVGDVLHSRVARSNIQALKLLGAHVTLVGPPALLPRGIEAMGVEATTDIGVIAGADLVYVLRMQQERMAEGANYVPSLREYTARWGVTPERIRPGQKIMHPGPMNRGVEIDPRVADHADALIETQVRAGLVTRMAVLYDLLTKGRSEFLSKRPWGWRDAVLAKEGPKQDLVIRGARARSGGGSRRDARRPDRRRHDRGARRLARCERPSGRRCSGPRPRARVRRPARAPAHPGAGGRGDDRERHRGGGGRGLLRHPGHAEHRPGRRLVRGARRARRAGARNG